MREVFLPRSVDELWSILDAEPKAAVYAGGTDLLVKLRSAAAGPRCLVCIERIEELRGVEDRGDWLRIGAVATHSQLLEHPLIGEHFPVLGRGLSVLGSPPIRHMGTIGGNIVTASPAGDTLPALYVLGAEIEVLSRKGSRRMPLRDFILGPGAVDLRTDELLTAVWIRKQPQWTVHHYEKVGRRKAQACAVASMAALLRVTGRRIEDVRLAWGSVAPTVLTVAGVETALRGASLSVEALRPQAPLVEAAAAPIDDVRASAEYRRVVAGSLLLRLAQYGGT